MAGHPYYMLGKKAAVKDKRTLQWDSIIKTKVAVPSSYDFDTSHKPMVPLPMFANDRYGCHSADTEVLTEHGWKKWPDYDGRSLLGTMNQDTGYLEFQAPLAVQRYNHNGAMAFTEHAHLDFALTPDHRMFYSNYYVPSPYVKGGAGWEPYQFGEISQLPTRCRIPGATTGFIGTQLDELTIGNRKWNGTDFLRVLALILSDGWVSGSVHHPARLSFCCMRNDRIEMIREFAHKIGLEEKSREGVWTWTDAALVAWLKANAYIGNEYRAPHKRIPDLVKVADQHQINEFLRYFGDQHLRDQGNCHYYSSSSYMIDDLQELLLRVGKRSRVFPRGIRPQTGNKFNQNYPAYELHEYVDSNVTMQRLERLGRPVVYDHYKGEVFCATVPNSTLITRRNGHVMVSGNCCVISGRAHQTLRFELLEQKEVINISDREVINEYFKESGGRDTGLVVLYSLRAWRQGWRAGGKVYSIQAFSEVNPRNHQSVMEAVYLDAGVGIGLSLPVSASKQINQGQIWDVARIGGRPGSWGGHYVYVVGYNSTGPICVTWGRKQPMTWAFWDKYCDECYAVIDAVDSRSTKLRNALDKSAVVDYLLDLDGKPVKKTRKKSVKKAAKKVTKKSVKKTKKR